MSSGADDHSSGPLYGSYSDLYRFDCIQSSQLSTIKSHSNYQVLTIQVDSITGFDQGFPRFANFYLVLPGFNLVFLGFTEHHTKFYLVLLDFTYFYRILVGFT